jgi:hypothetical protein
LQTLVHLPVEEVGYGLIVEGHGDFARCLQHKLNVFHVKQVVGPGNSKATHLRFTQITQEQ